MLFWNGSRWVEDAPAPAPAKPSALHNWAATALMVLSLAAIAVPIQLVAAASHQGGAGCAVNPSAADVGESYTVHAWGIPTSTAVNLWVTRDGATTGYPLGGTPDGTFNLNDSSSSAGVTTYTFSGPTRAKMKIYGTCSVSTY